MSAVPNELFSDEQKEYLQGFLTGSGFARPSTTTKPDGPAHPLRPESIHLQAQDRFTAAGNTLVPEELAKRNKHGLDMWDEILAHARDAKFPKGTDVFLFKFNGLFYVAPAQDAFMCRLRFPAGVVTSHQMRGLADLAERFAGGYADVTTRANLQLREIGPKNTVELLLGLSELGIINRGAGADNIRNITATPTAGFDRQELIDTRPLARELHHYIINHRELYGLPRKFNVSFDGGGVVSVLEDTNDIGFAAVRVDEGKTIPSGVYFRMQLAGITGHQQFASDTGILIKPDQCLPVAIAVIKAFIEHGDRTDRRKARLKYVIDRMGLSAFLSEVEKHLPEKLPRQPMDICGPRPAAVAHAHIGVHAQKQQGMYYIGVIAPAARLKADQLRALADIADQFGQRELRLTVWQNILIPSIAADDVQTVKQRIEEAGLTCSSNNILAGLVACTGNGGCKFAASDTKQHSLQIADYVESHGLKLDQPVNIHLTGCHHSCAQHYIGDIGLLATKIGEEAIEGYHVYVGGGYGARQEIGRELYRDIPATDLPQVVDRILRNYMHNRATSSETFLDFVRRHPAEQLKDIFDDSHVEAA